jgi:hypothetical protein
LAPSHPAEHSALEPKRATLRQTAPSTALQITQLAIVNESDKAIEHNERQLSMYKKAQSLIAISLYCTKSQTIAYSDDIQCSHPS